MVDDPLVSTQYKWIDIFFSGWIADVAGMVLILLIGFVIGKLVEKILQRFLRGLKMGNAAGTVRTEELLAKLASYAIFSFTVVVALQELGIAGIVALVVIAVVLGFMAISLLLTVSDFVPNALAGFFSQKKFVVGETVDVHGIKGEVVRRRLAEVWLETDDGMMVVPNSKLR